MKQFLICGLLWSFFCFIMLSTLSTSTAIAATNADLVITDINGPSSVIKGNNIEVTSTVHNQGSQDASNFCVDYYLNSEKSMTSGSHYYIGYRSLSSLDASASDQKTNQLNVPNNIPAGLYYFSAKADSGNQISEPDENNNIGYSLSQINVQNPYIDLVSTSVSLVGSQQTFLNGSQVQVDSSVKNYGNINSPAFNTNIWITTTKNPTGGTRYYIGTTYTSSLAPDVTKSNRNTFTIPSITLPGNYYLMADPDPSNLITESSETDNKGYSPYTINVLNPHIDLVATSVNSTPTTLNPSEQITVDSSVKNYGNINSPAFNTNIWITTTKNPTGGTRYYIGTTYTSSLAPDVTKSNRNTFTIPSITLPGNYYLMADPDPSNLITESSETDNKGYSPGQISVSGNLNPNPPSSTAKLIFIHHSCGQNWLSDSDGGLGISLRDNNYFVSDTNYGWGPDGIGSNTDTSDWPTWFIGPNSNTYMSALYSESGQSFDYSRLATDPGGDNEIIMFKSCFPNSEVGDSVDDEKAIYNSLKAYFAAHPEKLFVLITPPGETNVESYLLTRDLCNWLVDKDHGWLSGYTGKNVFVFDLYGVLSEVNSHHRYISNSIEHVYAADYDGISPYHDGNDHPNSTGNQKATTEFVTLLNTAYNQWKT